MKNVIYFVLSELFFLLLAFGILMLAHPGIPLTAAVIGAMIVYVFSTGIMLILQYAAIKYFEWKGSKNE